MMKTWTRIGWGAAFGAAGFVLNLTVVELMPSAHFVMGPFAVLSAAVLFGPIGGGMAGAIASIPTIWRWGHPFGWLNFTLEAISVGFLSRRFTPLVADFLYWLLSPLYFFLTYHLAAGIPGPLSAVMGIKQAINSLLFALLIQVLLLLPALRNRLAAWLPPPVKDVHISTAFRTVLAFSAVIPLLLLGGAEGRARYDVELQRMASENLKSAESIRDELERTIGRTVHTATQLAATLSSEPALPPQEQLEKKLEELLRYSPELSSAYVGSPEGVALAFFPTHDLRGRPLAGSDYSDRGYVQQLKSAYAPVVTGIFQGRGGVNGPLVIVAAPIRSKGRYLGYVLSGLKVSSLRQFVQEKVAGSGQRALVVDAEGNVVSDSDGETLDGVENIAGSALEEAMKNNQLGEAATYVARPHRLWAIRASSMRHFGAVAAPTLNWKVVVEQPTAQLQRRVERSYVGLLIALGAAIGALLVIATALARMFLFPIQKVSEAAQMLSGGDRRARAQNAARNAPLELRQLAERFDDMADQLAQKLDAIEGAAREKDAFLTVAAHELRTPITALKVQVQLARRKLNDAEGERLDTVDRQIDRLTRLVNQLMDASQLASGRLPLEIAPVDLAEVARRVAEPMVAASTLHELSLEVEPTNGLYDELRLEQVMHNLLSNAVKYSPTGGPIEVSVKQQESGAVVTVADRGIGLGAADKVQLFERFARGTVNELNGISGLGVGLYVSREIVRRHGGTISLLPREGGGAVARIELPRRDM